MFAFLSDMVFYSIHSNLLPNCIVLPQLHGEKSARMQQWQADLRVRDSRLREAELDLERRTESVKRVLDPFSA
jgi:hypothetical protein